VGTRRAAGDGTGNRKAAGEEPKVKRKNMDKRFTDIRPMTCKNKDAGSEPPLQYVLEHYYTSHGINLDTARKLTGEYIAEWLKQESSTVYVSSHERPYCERLA
jgi:hypothetical protein